MSFKEEGFYEDPAHGCVDAPEVMPAGSMFGSGMKYFRPCMRKTEREWWRYIMEIDGVLIGIPRSYGYFSKPFGMK